jgi:glycosyltransferase involved in cell wall biosynthesis
MEHGVTKHEAHGLGQRADLAENRADAWGDGPQAKLNTEHCAPALVFVGSGELEGALREQARALGLRVVDRTDWKAGQSSHGLGKIGADLSERLAADRTGGDASCRVTPAVGGSLQKETDDCEPTAESSRRASQRPTDTDDSGAQGGAVFFYGFRQIEENPVFYALAEAFVLPSLKEEWGLVVNEAMAAGLPVIVSRTAGCAEDLLPEATASRRMEHGAWSMESGENAGSLNVASGPSPAIRPTVQPSSINSLEERSNGFVFDPSSVDALSEALRRIADPLNPQRSTLNAAAMGRRSLEIVAKFSCENFAKHALRAAEAAQQA